MIACSVRGLLLRRDEDTSAEEAAIKAYDALMAAKTKEVNALTKAIEEKMTRVGELAVEIVFYTFPPPSPTNISNTSIGSTNPTPGSPHLLHRRSKF